MLKKNYGDFDWYNDKINFVKSADNLLRKLHSCEDGKCG